MKTLIALICALSLFQSGPALAEIVKSSVPCEGNNCLYWWPKAPSPPGWHRDKKASEAGGINAQAPDGSSFNDAETVIYAKAMYKPLVPTITSLTMLIDDDRKDFLSRDPKLTVGGPETLITGDGTVLHDFKFSPGDKGNWEEVAYGEEGNFFLIFTISSRTKAGLQEKRGDYLKFIKGYLGKP